MLAALNGSSLCSANSECVNTHGSYECVCVPGYDLTNGTCHSMLHDCALVVNTEENESCTDSSCLL